jgi:hypothetical protein
MKKKTFGKVGLHTASGCYSVRVNGKMKYLTGKGGTLEPGRPRRHPGSPCPGSRSARDGAAGPDRWSAHGTTRAPWQSGIIPVSANRASSSTVGLAFAPNFAYRLDRPNTITMSGSITRFDSDFPTVVIQRQMKMTEMSRNEQEPLCGDDALPATLFKNSLRRWQASWQAQNPSPVSATTTPPKIPRRPRKTGLVRRK